MLEQFRQRFIEEVVDLLNKLEKSLLTLEKNMSNKDLITEVFRIMHTIKGSAGMYDLKVTVEITHKLESVYASIRDQKANLNRDILSISFQSIDLLRRLVTSQNEKSVDNKLINEFINNLDDLVIELEHKKDTENKQDIDNQIIDFFDDIETEDHKNISTNNNEDGNDNSDNLIHLDSKCHTYYIQFLPESNINTRGINIKAILDDLQNFEYHKIIPHSRLHEDSKFFMFWEIFIATEKNKTELEDIFLFVADETKIEKISEINLLKISDFNEEIEKNLSENQLISKNILKNITEQYLKYNTNNQTDIQENELLNRQQQKPEPEKIDIVNQQIAISEQKTSSIKVASEKLDELMNLVSELVTTKAELDLYADQNEDETLNSISEKIEKIIKKLRENALNIRLIPIESVILRFERLVRDLSFELGKQVDFLAEGTETELDKNIIDNLSIPLMHIIRNAIDHGIETEERRLKLGKTPKGVIRLVAFYSGSNVFIQVRDDGAGINPTEIRNKAIERNLIAADQQLSNKEVYDLLFLPGFSTAKNITDISGRGVGMDVVKKTIIDLRGEIDIDSEVNLGTSVTIKLPLTLSIVDTLLVNIANSKLLIPLSNVDSCGQILHSKLVNQTNQRIAAQGELIPYIYLREKFGIYEETPEYESIIFVKYKDKKVALIFDSIEGEHQAVLKSLGDVFVKQEFISGGSILGDGTVALILDTNKLIKQFS